MADLDLRPRSLGEILDRTFSLYRQNFLLFVGITALPQLLTLGLHLGQAFWGLGTRGGPRAMQPSLAVFWLLSALVGLVVYLVAYLFSQGGTVYAVSDLYLGRSTSIGAALRRMRGEVGNLFGVTLLNGLAIFAAFIFLIVPGVYLACRLIVCVPAALLENLGPRDSLERSFKLTQDSAGRSFLIYLLYLALLYGAVLLFVAPFLFAMALSAKDPAAMQMWLAVSQTGSFVATVLVTPILTIATAVFYYDLRVRKEAFDLQLMMNPVGNVGATTAGVPTMLS
jgi:hypothetical protein